jgi:hypothetical protein
MKIIEYTAGRIGIDDEHRLSRGEFAIWLRNAKRQAKKRGERVRKYRVRSTVGFVLVGSDGSESQAFMSYRDFSSPNTPDQERKSPASDGFKFNNQNEQ